MSSPVLGEIAQGSKIDKWRGRYIWQACTDCGKKRWVQVYRTGVRSIRCQRCSTKLTWKSPSRGRNFKRREEHHAWKGGRTISQGYVRILCPEHPRADRDGYVREHLLVWEKTHSKRLPEGWVLHHLNGIRADNRPSNLFAMLGKKHSVLLPALQKRIQELEAQLKLQGQLL